MFASFSWALSPATQGTQSDSKTPLLKEHVVPEESTKQPVRRTCKDIVDIARHNLEKYKRVRECIITNAINGFVTYFDTTYNPLGRKHGKDFYTYITQSKTTKDAISYRSESDLNDDLDEVIKRVRAILLERGFKDAYITTTKTIEFKSAEEFHGDIKWSFDFETMLKEVV